MSAAVVMFTSRRARHQSSASNGGEGATLLLRYLNLDAQMSAAEEAGDFDAWVLYSAASSDTLRSPFTAYSAIRALNPASWFLRVFMS